MACSRERRVNQDSPRTFLKDAQCPIRKPNGTKSWPCRLFVVHFLRSLCGLGNMSPLYAGARQRISMSGSWSDQKKRAHSANDYAPCACDGKRVIYRRRYRANINRSISLLHMPTLPPMRLLRLFYLTASFRAEVDLFHRTPWPRTSSERSSAS